MMIALRQLTLQTSKERRTVEVRIFAPQITESDWSCRYEIDWPHAQRAFQAHGLDAMQALILALQMIGAEIYASAYHQDGGLFWERPGGGYGFPTPPGFSDLLVGDDATGP